MEAATKINLLPPQAFEKPARKPSGGLANHYKAARAESARKQRAPFAPVSTNVPPPLQQKPAAAAEIPVADDAPVVRRMTRDADGAWTGAPVAEPTGAPVAEPTGSPEPSVDAIRAEIEAIQATLDPETAEAAARQLDLLAEYESAWDDVRSPEKATWTRCYDAQYDTFYYHNDADGTSSWEPPSSGVWVDDEGVREVEEARDAPSPLRALERPAKRATLSLQRRDVLLGLFVVAFSVVVAVSLANYGARQATCAAPRLLGAPDAKADLVDELQSVLAALDPNSAAVREPAASTPFGIVRRGLADLFAPLKALRALVRVLKKLLLLN